MTNSAHCEKDVERTRDHLNDTLAELRSRMTVGQVADQVWDLAKESLGGDFAKNLARQAANNPMPVALMGTGLAWLMFAKPDGSGQPHRERIEREVHTADGLGVAEEEALLSNRSIRRTLRRMKGSATRTMHDARDAAAAGGSAVASGYETVAEGASDLATSAYDTAKHGADSAKATASSAYETIKQRAGAAQEMAASAYEKIKEGAMETNEMAQTSAKAVGEYATGTAQRVADFCVENPLVLIGAGLALGAIAGAILPATKMENDLMGEASDSVKQQAERLAASQVEKVERVGEEIIDRASETASREFADLDAQLPKDGMSPPRQQGNIVAP